MVIERLEVTCGGRAECVPLVRTILAGALRGLPSGVVDDALLCATELMANAVTHSASGLGRTFDLVCTVTGRSVRIEVTDAGGPQPMMMPPADTRHRGLPIVAALGTLGITGDERGHTVTATIPLPTAGPCRTCADAPGLDQAAALAEVWVCPDCGDRTAPSLPGGAR